MATSPITHSALPLNHVFAPRKLALPPLHAVQVVDAAAPRQPGRLARVANYVVKKVRLLAAGQGPRADANHRHHLKKASRAMDRFLSTLIENPGNAESLNQSLHAMARAAGGLSKGMEVSVSELYSVRATVQLERLTDEQLSEVIDNLAHWATLEPNAALADALSQLHRLANKEQARRDMFVVFRGILDHRAAGPAAAGLRFERALQSTNLLVGKLVDDDTPPRTRQLCLTKELLNQSMDNGSLSLDEVQLLLDSLPSELLHEWLQAQYPPEFHDARAIDQQLDTTIARRNDRLEVESVAALSGVSRALNVPSDAAQLAVTVTTLATHLSALKAHCEASGLLLPAAITQPWKALQKPLTSALENAVHNLARLPREQLYPLVSALAALELDGSYTEPLHWAVVQLGIKTYPSGQVVFPGAKVQEFIAADLARLAATQKPPHTPLGQTLPTGVVEAMWLDLPRTTYAIEGEDGQVETLVSPADGFSVRSPELYTVTAGLQLKLKLDEAKLLALSRVANQELWGGLTELMQSPDSPIRLPDGTPGLVAGTPSDRFTVRLGPQGQLIVRCEHELKNISALANPRDLSTTLLDPAQSHAWFSREYEIGTDNQVRVTQPLVCSYALVPAAG